MIVTSLNLDSVTICGVVVNRPPFITSTNWQNLWQQRGYRQEIDTDWWSADVFGTRVTRPAGITGLEWSQFWGRVTSRRIVHAA